MRERIVLSRPRRSFLLGTRKRLDGSWHDGIVESASQKQSRANQIDINNRKSVIESETDIRNYIYNRITMFFNRDKSIKCDDCLLYTSSIFNNSIFVSINSSFAGRRRREGVIG